MRVLATIFVAMEMDEKLQTPEDGECQELNVIVHKERGVGN
jgi:hypothetical protein